jgi:hypothetical protein
VQTKKGEIYWLSMLIVRFAFHALLTTLIKRPPRLFDNGISMVSGQEKATHFWESWSADFRLSVLAFLLPNFN